MSDLSQSLIDAAGKAVYDEIKKWWSGAVPGFAGATQQDVGRVAVAAVLETLAADEAAHRFGYPLHDLRRLASEVREGRTSHD